MLTPFLILFLLGSADWTPDNFVRGIYSVDMMKKSWQKVLVRLLLIMLIVLNKLFGRASWR